MIALDVPNRSIAVEVSEAELAQRREAFRPPAHDGADRGYKRLFLETVLQADQGCDFDFLVPRRTGSVPETLA